MHLGPQIYGRGDQGAIQITPIAQQVWNFNACVQIIAEEEQRRYKNLLSNKRKPEAFKPATDAE